MDCSLPGSHVHGILQARILEWVAISFSKGIFPTQGLNPSLPYCRDSLPSQPPGKPRFSLINYFIQEVQNKYINTKGEGSGQKWEIEMDI